MVIHSNNDITSNANALARQKAGSANLSSNSHSPAAEKPAENNATKNVQLSQEAQSIKRLETKIEASEGVDTAKVDHIKQKIADGNYEINSQSIAEKIIKQDQLLG